MVSVQLLILFIAAVLVLRAVWWVGSDVPYGYHLVGCNCGFGAMPQHSTKTGNSAAILTRLKFFLGL